MTKFYKISFMVFINSNFIYEKVQVTHFFVKNIKSVKLKLLFLVENVE